MFFNAQILYDNGPIIDTEGRFELEGRKWNKSNLTYFFENGTSDISGNSERIAVKDAFTVWSNASGLTFTEVFNAATADIVIKWATGNHGDGASNSFDGTNGVLAHAFYPPPNSGSLAGDVHFDDDETWTDQIRSNSFQPIDLVTVAIHEIGHSLGLAHSSDPNAIMYAYYSGSRRQLSNDDFSAIDSLYPKNMPISGQNSFCNTSQQQTYTIPLLPNGIVATWTHSTNLTKISETPNSITVSSNTNENGEFFVKATIGTKVIIKYLNMGVPYITNTAERPSHCHFTFRAKDYYPTENSDTTFSWSYVTGTGNASPLGFGTSGDFATVYACPPFTFRLKITANNSCGTTERFVDLWLNNDDEEINRGTNNNVFTISPNPSSDYVNISLVSKTKTLTQTGKVQAELYNSMGNKVRSINLNNNKGIISLSGLLQGIYTLKIIYDSQVESHQIIKK